MIEYLEIKPFWTRRLFDSNNNPIKYDHISFRNGYGLNCPKMKVEFKGIKIKKNMRFLWGELLKRQI